MYCILDTRLLDITLPPVGSVMLLGSAYPICNWCKSIYIRTAYDDIAKLIISQLPSSGSTSCFSSLIIVCGTPGVGKSMFLPYLQVRLNHAGFRLCFKYSNGWIYHDSQTSQYVPNELDILFLDPSKTIILLDAASLSQYVNFTCILAASPDMTHMKAAMKFRQCTKFYMPPWSLEELQACNVKIDEYLFLSCEELHVRFKKWGGIPRIVFANSLRTVEDNFQSCLSDEGVLTALIHFS